jgi:hypothetical protein
LLSTTLCSLQTCVPYSKLLLLGPSDVWPWDPLYCCMRWQSCRCCSPQATCDQDSMAGAQLMMTISALTISHR